MAMAMQDELKVGSAAALRTKLKGMATRARENAFA
jgi:hypothetical protein